MLFLLCIMLDSYPDRRGRTSVGRRVTHFLDQRQRINTKFAKSMSASATACLPSGRKRCQSLSPRTRAWHCAGKH